MIRSLLLAALVGLAVPALATPPTFDDVTALEGLRIVNEPILDWPPSSDVPDPVTWNHEVTDNFPFYSFTIYVHTANSERDVPRSSGSGALAISDEWALVADHAKGIGDVYAWMTPAGVVVVRARDAYYDLRPFNNYRDVGLIHLSEPLPPEIVPVAFLTHSACLDGVPVACLEQDRHINVMECLSSAGLVAQPATEPDRIEGGDSGKCVLAFIDGVAVAVIPNFSQAFNTNYQGELQHWAIGDCPGGPSAQNLELQRLIEEKLATTGDSLTIINSDPDPEPEPEPPTPGRYHVTSGGAAVTVNGTPLTFDVE